MARRAGGILMLAASLLLVFMGALATASPSGPRLAVIKLREPEWTQLFTVAPDGGALESLYAGSAFKATKAVYPWSTPSWSPDGSRIAFTTLDEEFPDFGDTGTSLAWISADGGPVKRIPATANGFEPLFLPDGHTIAFAKQREFDMPRKRHGDGFFKSVAVWLVDLETGKSRPLTPWRDELFNWPVSASPDGSRLAVTRRVDRKALEAIEIGLDGKPIRVLARNAFEPVYSPDGRSIALLRGPYKEVTRHFPRHGRLNISAHLTDIFIRSASGGGLRQVTDTDRAAEEIPRWDPSGQRLVYTEWRPFDYGKETAEVQESVAFGFGKAIRTINADGTCPTTVLSGLDSMYFAAAWQPGVGREAAPASC
jgi:Tol biopolymer transport system component